MQLLRFVVQRLEEGLIALLLAALTLLTCAQAVVRYRFDYTFPWAHEVTSVMFAWLIFLGIPYGVRVGSHIGLDALVKMMGPVGARITGAAAALLCVAYALILLVASWSYAGETRTARIILLLSFALLAFRFGQVFWRIVRGHR